TDAQSECVREAVSKQSLGVLKNSTPLAVTAGIPLSSVDYDGIVYQTGSAPKRSKLRGSIVSSRLRKHTQRSLDTERPMAFLKAKVSCGGTKHLLSIVRCLLTAVSRSRADLKLQ